MKYHGSCHCGRIAFDVDGKIASLLRHVRDQPYAEAKDRQGNPTAAVNLRCVEGIGLDKIPVEHFDGRAL